MTMFTTLHPLAQAAQLMITIAAEGADQLRVNVTPLPSDTQAKAKLPQPLSLVATPAEFDVEFAAAIATWQSPKRSLIQQAQEATKDADIAGVPADSTKAGKIPRRTAATKKMGAADETAKSRTDSDLHPKASQGQGDTADAQANNAASGTPGSENSQEIARSGASEAADSDAAPAAQASVPATEPAAPDAAVAAADTATLNLF